MIDHTDPTGHESLHDHSDGESNSGNSKKVLALGSIIAFFGSITYLGRDFIKGTTNVVRDYPDQALMVSGAALSTVAVPMAIHAHNHLKPRWRRNLVAFAGVSAMFGGGFLVIKDESQKKQDATNLTAETSSTLMVPDISVNGPQYCEIAEQLPVADSDGLTMKKIQAALNDAGFDAGPVDGDQGVKTTRALTGFKIFYEFDPGERFSVAMCNKLPSLVDGDLTTPVTP